MTEDAENDPCSRVAEPCGAALQKYDELFIRLLHISSVPAAFVSLQDKTFLFANQTFAKMIGRNREELFGKCWDDIGFWADIAQKERLENLLMQHQDVVNTEISYLSSNGELRYAIAYFEIVQYFNDEYILIHLLDITTRKSAENELVTARLKAEEINQLKSSFFSNMSHELRTPLMGILGCSDILKETLRSERDAHMVDIILKSSYRLLNTVELILDITRLESDAVTPIYENVDIVPLILECVNMIESRARKKNLELHYKFSQLSVTLDIDRQLFRESILHLLDNAVKFTEFGSIFVNLDLDTEHIEISVADTGIGIESDKLEIIFQEFRQISQGINRSFEGVGLGLTIARRFIEMLNGEIKVESTLGKGTTFTIHLPIKEKGNNMEPDELRRESANDTPQKQVLLVENDEINIDVISSMLSGVFLVDIAITGQEAIQKTSEKRYDLILMDINLGRGMNGMQATQAIKKNPAYENIPVIAMTAFAMLGDKEEFLKGGCTHYLSKPFTRQQILKFIENIFESE